MSVQHEHFYEHLSLIIPPGRKYNMTQQFLSYYCTSWVHYNTIWQLSGVYSASVCQLLLDKWLSVVCAFSYLNICCADAAVQLTPHSVSPKEALVRWMTCMCFLASVGRTTLKAIHSLSWTLAKMRFAEMPMPWKQQPRCPSNHPSGHSFKQQAPHPIYIVFHPWVNLYILSAC